MQVYQVLVHKQLLHGKILKKGYSGNRFNKMVINKILDSKMANSYDE